MKKWLVVHSLDSYGQNPRMIGLQAKTKLDGSVALSEDGIPVPVMRRISEVRPGDRIVYYCKGDSVIKGIFEVVQPQFAKEKLWPDSPFQFEIKPIIELEEPYDFKLLLSSLDLFKGLPDLRHWGSLLQGMKNSLKPLSDHDYDLIEKSISQAKPESQTERDEAEEDVSDYRQHLKVQYKIADLGIKNGHRVHIAVNDRGKIKEKLPSVLDDIPHFHTEAILDIAKRIDVLFFDKEHDILTHAFEVEHTSTIYSGLLRLNDVAESYPSGNIKFLIVSEEENREKFDREIVRPSFYLLNKCGCRFINYEQVNAEWGELKKRKPPIF